MLPLVPMAFRRKFHSAKTTALLPRPLPARSRAMADDDGVQTYAFQAEINQVNLPGGGGEKGGSKGSGLPELVSAAL
jgi:hypothetical protein